MKIPCGSQYVTKESDPPSSSVFDGSSTDARMELQREPVIEQILRSASDFIRHEPDPHTGRAIRKYDNSSGQWNTVNKHTNVESSVGNGEVSFPVLYIEL